MEKIDHIIHAKWIITCEDHNQTLEDHALLIKDEKILDIVPSNIAKEKYTGTEHHYNTHALLPGFINAHTHIAMNIFRGLADDLELMDWLSNHIWPAERKWVSHELVYDASLLAMAEMIRSGTTCFNDMYFFLDATADAALKAGMRAHIGITVIDFPTEWAKDVDEYFAKGLAFYEKYKKNYPQIVATFAPQGTYTVKEKDLARIKELADQYNLQVNIHCQEALSDIEGALKLNNKRPLQCLNDVGLVSPRLITIHMTQLNDEDFALLAEKKPHVVHCPESNMKLASGMCPIHKLRQLGVNVALGTDGAASNNDLDMISEMRTAAFLAKLCSRDAKALPAEEALKMATINGAKALGIDKITGSLTPGKSADFIAIDLERIETQPLYNPISQIVYSTSRDQVTDVWILGKQCLRDRKLLTLNEKEILERTQKWRTKIKN